MLTGVTVQKCYTVCVYVLPTTPPQESDIPYSGGSPLTACTKETKVGCPLVEHRKYRHSEEREFKYFNILNKKKIPLLCIFISN